MSTLDLNAIAIKAVENIVASGAFEKKIEASLQKSIEDIISEQLSWSSGFYKELKEVIKEKLQVDLSSLDLPVYNEYLLANIQQLVSDQLKTVGLERIEGKIADLLKREVKPQYTLKELLEEFKSDERDYKATDDQCTLHIEVSEYSYRIAIDEGSDEERYHCTYRFAISKHDNTIYGLDFSGGIKTKNEALNILSASSFGNLLLRIKAAGSKVLVETDDPDDYNLCYHEEEGY